jgi:predicted ATPase/class 3 adenylate cyclase
MAELPTGSVTLLFTDIEGSTRLLEQLGDGYLDVLGAHQRLLRAAFAESSGVEVNTEGDAFFVAFATARDAVAAAVRAQRALAGHAWPDGVGLRVRMGMHTGEPLLVGNDYAGLDVHRTARICAAGHGGQVLISQATRDLVEHRLPTGVTLRDLGEHRLRDLTRPQHLFQLVIAGLPAEFPPLRTLSTHPTNLPAELTPLIGRASELAEASALLQRDTVRLVTFTGPGGIGKTRLAVHVAAALLERFREGVFVVELAAVRDPSLVVPTIAHTLGVRETADRPLFDGLVQRIGGQRLLLVLDNFEQVLAAAPAVVRLLRACRRVKVLVTSRAVLHASGEYEYPVPPLALPEPEVALDLDALLAADAVALFVARAQAVNPGFGVTEADAPVLAEICRWLDGVPLAIELAAARSRLLSPRALLARLQERGLRLLTGGASDLPARQQTLRATIDWSYDILAHAEQRLLARLSVFAGGATLAAAEAVCDLEGERDLLAALDSLIDNSMVRVRTGPHGEPRMRMLETVREYARERLAERDEADELARRHADFYMALADRAEPKLSGPDQGEWLSRLDTELDNLRAAFTWSIARQEPDMSARLATALGLFWEMRGRANEGLQWLETVLGERELLSREALARALVAKARLLLRFEADHEQGRALLDQALPLVRELGDTAMLIRTLNNLGYAAIFAGDEQGSLAFHHEALLLARQHGDPATLALVLANFGSALLWFGDHARARTLLEESLVLRRGLGEPLALANTLNNLAMLALSEGEHERALPLLEECLALARRVGHLPWVAGDIADLGLVALFERDYDRALSLFTEGLILSREAGHRSIIAECLWGLAAVAAGHLQPTRAVRLWAATAAMYTVPGIPPSAARRLEESLLPGIRHRLGRHAFDVEWARGHAMSMEDAIAYALNQHPARD